MVGLTISLSLFGIVGGLTVWAILDDRRAEPDEAEAWKRVEHILRERRARSKR